MGVLTLAGRNLLTGAGRAPLPLIAHDTHCTICGQPVRVVLNALIAISFYNVVCLPHRRATNTASSTARAPATTYKSASLLLRTERMNTIHRLLVLPLVICSTISIRRPAAILCQTITHCSDISCHNDGHVPCCRITVRNELTIVRSLQL